jgi:hypothetical protein
MANFDFLLGNQTDPMRQMGQFLTLAQLSRQNRMGQEDESARNLERQSDMLAANAYTKARQSGDFQGALAELSQQGEAGALATRKLVDFAQKQAKGEADVQFRNVESDAKRAGAEKDRASIKLDGLKQFANLGTAIASGQAPVNETTQGAAYEIARAVPAARCGADDAGRPGAVQGMDDGGCLAGNRCRRSRARRRTSNNRRRPRPRRRLKRSSCRRNSGCGSAMQIRNGSARTRRRPLRAHRRATRRRRANGWRSISRGRLRRRGTTMQRAASRWTRARVPRGRCWMGSGQPIGQVKDSKQATQSQRALAVVDQAEGLIDKATGSYAGAATDEGARIFGKATAGAQAIAELKVLEGALISNQPRMEGPQSDKDVMLYRQMAGQIGDPTVPPEQKRAALRQIRALNEKYASISGNAPSRPAAPKLGERRDGYIYKGGDPASQSSWEKL